MGRHSFSPLSLVLFFFSFAFVSFSSLAAQAQDPLPTLSAQQGRTLAQRCAWAPRDGSVCKARTFCKADPHNSKCAKYCHVNPYDVVCGDVYRPHYEPAPPSYGDSPYPWARAGGGYCADHPYSVACQNSEVIWDRH